MAKLTRQDDSFRTIWQDVKRGLKLQLVILGTFVAILWGLEIVDSVLLGGYLDHFGIRPRTVSGLWGILLAPFLHGGLGHLAANTGPLVVLGWLIMWRKTSDFFVVSLIGGLVAGLGTWLIGSPNSVHIGASGLCFAYLGYLLLRGFFERRLFPIIGSVVVGGLYGGLIFGILPGTPGISWQGHLFGFLGGILAAWLMVPRQSPTSSA
ncbi:MAG: rhomboid family intramembrane serine protease [Myxococcales bacterium]|nr:rhomboid family intramembrane serine protease [Myxococcales bacterium]